MSASRPLLICLAGLLSACDQSFRPDDGGAAALCDLKTVPPDMTVVPAKCAAAKGLSGDNLLCVDFSQVQMLSSLSDWNFGCTGGAWISMDGMLQVNNFGMFDKDCTATLPRINLNDADKADYKTLTLSLLHRIDLNDPEQQAEIYLNANTALRRMYQATGKKDVPRQKTVIEIDKAALPAALNNTPQWILRINSTGMFSRLGWQIESIAINASK